MTDGIEGYCGIKAEVFKGDKSIGSSHYTSRDLALTYDLFHGECIERLKMLDGGSIDMVLCDLPYGTTGCKWDTPLPLDRLWAEYNRVVKPTGCIVLTGVQPFTSTLVTSNLKNFKYEIIWHKSKSGSGFTAKYRPISKHENILVFATGKTTYNAQLQPGIPYTRKRPKGSALNNHNLGLGTNDSETINTGYRYPGTVQFFQQKWRRQDQQHPAQKPINLLQWLVMTYTDEGDTVLDNCMGSGSTGVACVNTRRAFVGIEIDSGYFSTADANIVTSLSRVGE